MWFGSRVYTPHKQHSSVSTHQSAPDDGRKHRPKHVDLTSNNKLTYTVASGWLLL